MSRTGHHEALKDFLAGGQVWVGLGIMTTVAATILVFYKVQKP